VKEQVFYREKNFPDPHRKKAVKSIEVQTKVSFADGEILDCTRAGSSFAVQIRAWNSKYLLVNFKDVQLVLDFISKDISDFIYYDEETQLIQKALSYAYEATPAQHPFRHFAFINTCGEPCLEIVAAEMKISIE
jgi:hypothetical protein